MSNHLNIFNYYKDLDNWHEDVLTRNFLILFDNITLFKLGIFELIRSNLSSDLNLSILELNDIEVYTQKSNSDKIFNDIEGYTIYSILISDEHYKNEIEIKENNNEHRYDGVIKTNNKIFIIENKPNINNVWEEQLKPNLRKLSFNNDIVLFPNLCSLQWSDIIDLCNNLIKSSLINEIENKLLNDFIVYIDENYTQLNPYDKLSKCKNQELLINRRCDSILSKFGEIETHKGWYNVIKTQNNVIKQIALVYDEKTNKITLHLATGDTMTGCRDLYSNLNIDIFNNLLIDNYNVYPNFHMAHYGVKNFLYLESKFNNIIEYINYWKNQDIKKIKKEDFYSYYKKITDEALIQDDDKFNNEVLSKAYQDINVCPGIYITYDWTLKEAIELDDSDKFVYAVRDAINKVYSSFADYQIDII